MEFKTNRPLLALIAVLCLGISVASFGRGRTPDSMNTVPTQPASNITLDIAGGFITTEGYYGGSFLAGVQMAIDHTSPVRLGLDSGILFGSGTGLPILVSILYDFADRSAKTRPYIGGAVGPLIGLGGNGLFHSDVNDALVANVGAPAQYDSVKIAILLRPGVLFAVTDVLDVSAEMMTGGFSGYFYISPMLGVRVRL